MNMKAIGHSFTTEDVFLDSTWTRVHKSPLPMLNHCNALTQVTRVAFMISNYWNKQFFHHVVDYSNSRWFPIAQQRKAVIWSHTHGKGLQIKCTVGYVNISFGRVCANLNLSFIILQFYNSRWKKKNAQQKWMYVTLLVSLIKNVHRLRL